MIIYKATHKKNGKRYIGQAATLEDRLKSYKTSIKDLKRQTYFENALRKYSIDRFEWEEIDSAESQEELDYFEIYWIKFYRTRDKRYGYNLAEGGKVNRGYKWTEKSKERLSQSMKKKYANGELDEALASATAKRQALYDSGEMIPYHLGKKFSEETKQKISIANKGKRNSPKTEFKKGIIPWNKGIEWEVMQGQNNPNFGKTPSEEQKKKQSITLKTKYASGELKPSRLGAINSPETRLKISQAKAGKSQPNLKKSVECIETGQIFASIKDANKFFNVKHSHISSVCYGNRHISLGYHWKFANENDKLIKK